MKITIELSAYERWIIDTDQPEMVEMKHDIEKHANEIIKPLKDKIEMALDNGTAVHTLELNTCNSN